MLFRTNLNLKYLYKIIAFVYFLIFILILIFIAKRIKNLY